jgi:pimeloyl-ACP methyl ester carboxylesterase
MPTDSFHDRTLVIGTGSLHYRSWGTAGDLPDLLLEHGGGGSTQDWNLIAPLLAKHTRVFAYDRAGSGSSPRDDLGRGAVANSQRLSKLLEQLEIKKPFVMVGYSLGGLYARHYAALHPEQVGGLVLLDGTPTQHTHKKSDFKRALRNLYLVHWTARSGLGTLYWYLRGRKTMTREVFQAHVDRMSAPEFVPNIKEDLHAIASVQADVSACGERLTHPSLALIAGSAPKPTQAPQLAEVRVLHDRLIADAPAPLSRQLVVAEANHGTLVSEQKQAEIVAGHILAFLRDLSARSVTG